MKHFGLYLTNEQIKLLEEKTKIAGFTNKSDYVRFVVFTDFNLIEKINEIYKRLVENDK